VFSGLSSINPAPAFLLRVPFHLSTPRCGIDAGALILVPGLAVSPD
jgi:hypothetical protein